MQNHEIRNQGESLPLIFHVEAKKYPQTDTVSNLFRIFAAHWVTMSPIKI